MKNTLSLFLLSALLLFPKLGESQINEDKLGAWYMCFFNTTINESSWGFQGDIQYRNWNMGGDLEQLLLRGGLTFKPKQANIKFTMGYGNITSGEYGSGNATSSESRIYQEALFPTQLGKRFFINHRLRYEQRFVENQNLRTRYRYNFFLNIPINNTTLNYKTVYLALYNEIFINGERSIGNGNTVETFDRNRLYIGAGYVIKKGWKVQVGLLNQTTNGWKKNQLQFSFHQKF